MGGLAPSAAPTTDALSDVVRWRARAEAETQVYRRLSTADTVREKTPAVWDAFGDGLIDFARVRDIAATVDQLQREESVFRLDQTVIGYAVDHTAAELRQWLRRFVRRVEADLAVERAERERKNRHVSVEHTDDSMAWLNAYLPSHDAAAIEARLRAEARKPQEPGDDRTVGQREADLLVAWCTGSTEVKSAISATIAVTIGADVLAGANPGFAESADGSWAVPAERITDVIGSESTFWHRIITDPVTESSPIRSPTTSSRTSTSAGSPRTSSTSPCSSCREPAKRPGAWSRPVGATSTTVFLTQTASPTATTSGLCAVVITR